VVREFLKEVIEKEGRIITFKLGERGVKVMSEFRDVHSELHEDIGTGVLASLVFSIFMRRRIQRMYVVVCVRHSLYSSSHQKY